MLGMNGHNYGRYVQMLCARGQASCAPPQQQPDSVVSCEVGEAAEHLHISLDSNNSGVAAIVVLMCYGAAVASAGRQAQQDLAECIMRSISRTSRAIHCFLEDTAGFQRILKLEIATASDALRTRGGAFLCPDRLQQAVSLYPLANYLLVVHATAA